MGNSKSGNCPWMTLYNCPWMTLYNVHGIFCPLFHEEMLEKFHGQCPQYPGHCPCIPWTLSTHSMDSMDNIHGFHAMDSMENVQDVHGIHGFRGKYPWIPWKMSRMSMESMDFLQMGRVQSCVTRKLVHSFMRRCWKNSMDNAHSTLDIVHGFHGHCPHIPWNPWKMSRMSMESMDFLQT